MGLLMTAAQLFFAGMMDALVGDPRWFPHPVRFMGWGVARYDEWMRRKARTACTQTIMGIVLALGLPALVYVGALLIIDRTAQWDEALHSVVVVVLAWTTLAARDLVDHALPVLQALRGADLPSAR